MKYEKAHRTRVLLFALLTMTWMVVIFLFSCQNADESSEVSEGFLSLLGDWVCSILPRLSSQGLEHDIRKYAHMAEYMGLGISAILLFTEWLRRRPAGGITAVIFCLLYACSDEWHQTFVPGRSGSIRDVGIDSIGYMAGIAAVIIIMLLSDARKKKNTGVNKYGKTS